MLLCVLNYITFVNYKYYVWILFYINILIFSYTIEILVDIQLTLVSIHFNILQFNISCYLR